MAEVAPLPPLALATGYVRLSLADGYALNLAVERAIRWMFVPRPTPSLRERLTGWQRFHDEHGSWRERIGWRAALRLKRASLGRALSWRRWVHDNVVGSREWCE